jgi:NADPH:quinone reductase-like Zn-dependent oxidoreductase
MKAAVLHEIGGIPRYEDFPDPVAGDDEVVIDVKAVAVENVDKRIAAGTHYASRQYTAQLPAIPAFDGIGALPDGTLVGFGNPRRPYGALAEKTVVPKGAYMPIAEGIDPAIATVLGTAITGMSIKTAAGFVPGETVLVQGATGVAGRLAVKVARLLGARRIIATGRDNDQLREVQTLGADTVINTAVPDEALAQAYLDAKGDGYDVVLDYLWSRPTEILLRSLVPKYCRMEVRAWWSCGAGLLVVVVESAKKPVEVGLGVAPVERRRRLLVAALEGQQASFDLGQVGEVVRR